MMTHLKGISFLCLSVLFCGCLSAHGPGGKSATESVAEKKKNYADLYQALNLKQLKKGTPAGEIKSRFGQPDEVFHSGSSASGAFEVWTYEKILDRDVPEIWQLIRLYFNEDKLVDWKY